MDIDNQFFPAPSADMPMPGDCIVAEPLMGGSAFSRSVILMLDRDSSGGYLGLTLNKPAPLRICDILPETEGDAGNLDVWRGGPVDFNRLFVVHSERVSIPDSHLIGSGLYVGGSLEEINLLMSGGLAGKEDFRCFLGYSGWAPGQLEQEIAEGTWAVLRGVPANPLRGGGNDYWRRAVEQLGEAYRSWLIVPRSPAFN